MLRFKVAGMTCGHCVSAVTRAVQQIPAVEEVKVDLTGGEVTVRGKADPALISAAIIEEGYEVQAVA